MGIQELKVVCIRKNITLDKLASLIGINPASLYRKINGITEFQRSEIENITNVLELTDAELISIFFTPSVAKKQG